MTDFQPNYSKVFFSARLFLALLVGFIGAWWMLPFALSAIGGILAGLVPSNRKGDLLFVVAFLLATAGILAFPAYVFVTSFRQAGIGVRIGMGIVSVVLLGAYLACLLVVPVTCHSGLDPNMPPHCHTLLEAASHIH
jgi:hypothetical protein